MTRILAGRYELGPEIGRGGMGVVHRARDGALARPVAVKLVPASSARFVEEARRTAAIRHPAVIEVHDVGVDGDDAYLVMELLEGESLDQRIARTGRLEATLALEIGAAICGALEAAHALGIVHRDVKPANVFLLADGRVKVLDFGIAREITSAARLTETGAFVGTLTFMAPEQLRGEPVDGRADLYALGGTLYAALAGAPPFDDANAALLVRAVLELPPRPLRELVPDVPGPVEAAVLRLLEKAPRHRPESAAEARRLLAEARAGRTASTLREIELDPEAAATALDLAIVPVARPAAPALPVRRVPPAPPAVPLADGVLGALATVPPEVAKRVAAYGAFAVVLDVVFFHGSLVTLVPLALIAALGAAAYFAARRP